MKKLCPISILALTFALLSGCNQVTTTPDDNLAVSPLNVVMDSITTSSLEITGNGDWELQETAVWLDTHLDAGTGSTTVGLDVNPTGLPPGRYEEELTLSGVEGSDTATVTFLFPQVAGTVVILEQSSSSFEAQNVQLLSTAPGVLLVGFQQSRLPTTIPNPDLFHEVARQVAKANPGLALRGSYARAGVAVYAALNQRSAAAALTKNPHVRYVEPDHELELLGTSDTYRSLQWGLDTMFIEDAWGTSTGSGVRVAVIDSAFHPDHPDLAANITYQYDFGNANSTVTSANANCGTHGTHVAGVIGAITNNEEGVASVAPNASLLLLDVNDSSQDSCPIYTSSLIAALNWVAGDSSGPNADVVNISLGSATNATSLHDAVKAAHTAGATIVAAAGNDPYGNVLYPAAYPETIAVSSTGPTDEIASYSTTGPEVWVSAPGGDMNGSGEVRDSILSSIYSYSQTSNGYAYMDGTSMASPAVAGIAALIAAVNPNLKPGDIANVLADSSVDLGTAGRDDAYGHGRVDARQAVQFALTTTPTPAPVAYVLRTGDGRSIDIPEDGSFALGYVAPGSLTLEAGSDDNKNGLLQESGEYYGTVTLQVEFDGPLPAIELPVERQP